jgi:hypothetical protein
MYLIQQITNDPFQQKTLILPNGNSFVLQLYYMPMQLAWVISKLTYGSFTLTGIRVTNSPNILNQYQNQLPFGLACFSLGNREPTLQQDFSSGSSSLYVLSQAEVAQYQALLVSGANT